MKVLIFLLIATQWQLIDIKQARVCLPAGEKCYIFFNPQVESLELKRPDTLNFLAEQAIEYSPSWLEDALRNRFLSLSEENQIKYATLILNTPYPYIDEMAFQIAYLPPQILESPQMDTSLLRENVVLLYKIDSVLKYVEIVDVDTQGSYYSTVKYWVKEPTGDTIELILPPYYYYFFIVHPKLHKEFPAYIDPETGNPAPPPTGWFWRKYLFYHADSGYPLLSEQFDTIYTLWNSNKNSLDNGAVGVVTKWMQDVMQFEWVPHHDQPVYIYHRHKGTCTPWSYLTAAAARTCLIPATVTVAYRNNHKWNEFWERRWIQWEPVNTMIDDTTTYETWSSIGEFTGIFDWRGDGFVFTVTQRYTPICTLKVWVRDTNGKGIDGARIEIDAPGWPGPRATVIYTDNKGFAKALLGDSVDWFSAYVWTSIGTYPWTYVIYNSQPNMVYTWEPTISSSLFELKAQDTTFPTPPVEKYKIEISIEAEKQIIQGINPDDYRSFSYFTQVGEICFFVCDSSNFIKYLNQDTFSAFFFHRDAHLVDTSFTFHEAIPYYIVVSNEENAMNSQVVRMEVKLYKNVEKIKESEKISKQKFYLRLIPKGQNLLILYGIPFESDVEVSVYNIAGQKLGLIFNKHLKPGNYKFLWKDYKDLTSGIYFMELKSKKTLKKKFIKIEGALWKQQ